MTNVHAYLLSEARQYAERAANPVTAWDCIGARRWSETCMKLAVNVEGKTDEDALTHLKAVRAALYGVEHPNTGWGFYAIFSDIRQLDAIIDPIARDLTGWIVLGTHGGLDDGKCSTRPGYRRMLGINHCVSSCGRERGESDDAWLARRDAWLARYHPHIKVIRDHTAWSEDRTQYTSLVGNVAEIRKMRHLVERDLAEGIHILTSEQHPHSLVVVDAGPITRDDGVEFLARSVPEDGEEALPVGITVDTRYGRCAIVA